MGRKKIDEAYERSCPKCGKLLMYRDRSNFVRATKRDSVCRNCRTMPESMKKTLSKMWKGKKNPDYVRRESPPKNYIKKCPDCDNDISYVKKDAYIYAIRKNTKCSKCRMRDRIKETGCSYILTQDQINKMAATKDGHDNFEDYMETLPEFKKYKRKVTSITYKQPLETLEHYEKKGKMGKDGAYNIDHVISIKKGFINGIPPETIGDISNLQMIPWLDNIKKWCN